VTRVEQLIRTWRFGSPIIVVSGLPRSGTSMMMKILEAGGMPLLVDGVRAADEDNPNGYFEYEPVKQLGQVASPSWLRDARGRAVKIISLLLTWLPETYNYQVVFMQRDLDEIIASQTKMLAHRGEAGGKTEAGEVRQMYTRHLTQVDRFVANRKCFVRLDVSYRDVLEAPDTEARRISAFLGRPLAIDRMAAVADARLHRNRRP
jgi:hypothetical protein